MVGTKIQHKNKEKINQAAISTDRSGPINTKTKRSVSKNPNKHDPDTQNQPKDPQDYISKSTKIAKPKKKTKTSFKIDKTSEFMDQSRPQ